jgi:integrase
MSEKHITVWVQKFLDREYLMLQWLDPVTGKRKSRSAETNNPIGAERKRAELEYELNHGLYKEASNMSWERFRATFEEEYVAGRRLNTRRNFTATLDLFEKICNPKRLRSIDERTVSVFTSGMRKEPGRRKGSEGMMPSSIKVRLQYLHTALSWVVHQGLMLKVPRFPRVKPPQKDPQPVPVEAFERMLAKAKDDNMRAYLLTGWLAGLRLTEASLLEWEPTETAPYLDFSRNRIILPAEYVKADRDQWLPLDPQLCQVLEKLPRQRRKVFRFVNSRGTPLTVNGISQRVADLAEKASVRLTMKALRRGFGCRYAGKVSAHVLQRLMRHANLKITMTYYANIDAAVEEAVLGPQCNSSRNSAPEKTPSGENPVAVNPEDETPNSPSAS